MAWIELHDNLKNHPKTYALAKRLSIPRAYAVGLLADFWTWALSAAIDGEITRYSPKDIAEAALWEKRPAEFLDALINARWIDVIDDKVFIHDWDEYTKNYRKFLKEKEENKKRQQRYRNGKNNSYCNGDNNAGDNSDNNPPYRNLNHIDEEEEIYNNARTREDTLAEKWKNAFSRKPSRNEMNNLQSFCKNNPHELVELAIERAGYSSKTDHIKYIQVCLRGWWLKNCKTVDDVQISEDEMENYG